MNTTPTPDWAPFDLITDGSRGEVPRPLQTAEGVADRMRAAAFAEIQAREAFLWAADRFSQGPGAAPEALLNVWKQLAKAEDKHLGWLLERMAVLGFDVRGRKVTDALWHSFMRCESAEAFCVFMANAEDRGRKAGERFEAELRSRDAVTAEIFGKIAREEIEHIALAERFYPEAWKNRKATSRA